VPSKQLILKLMAQTEDQDPKPNQAEAENTQGTQNPNEPTAPIKGEKNSPFPNLASKLKIGIQKFSAMPVEQSNPDLPKLTTQSPPANLPQAPQPPKPKGSPFKFLSIFSLIFNWATFFLVIVITIFLITAGLILSYTSYTVYSPPAFFKNFINALIVKTPLPDQVQSLPEINFKKKF